MILILIRTVAVYLAVIITVRLLGKRQLSELQPSELVTAILLSNLASISIEDPSAPLLASLAPLFLITAIELLLSAIRFHSTSSLRFITGTPIIVVWNGEPDQQALCRLRFTMEDLLAALREKGIFDLQCVACAIIETNGSLSVCNYSISEGIPAHLPLPLILDGCIQYENLLRSGKDEEWLTEILFKERIDQLNVLAMFYDEKQKYSFIQKADCKTNKLERK